MPTERCKIANGDLGPIKEWPATPMYFMMPQFPYLTRLGYGVGGFVKPVCRMTYIQRIAIIRFVSLHVMNFRHAAYDKHSCRRRRSHQRRRLAILDGINCRESTSSSWLLRGALAGSIGLVVLAATPLLSRFPYRG